jgi:hypothetical protein
MIIHLKVLAFENFWYGTSVATKSFIDYKLSKKMQKLKPPKVFIYNTLQPCNIAINVSSLYTQYMYTPQMVNFF